MANILVIEDNPTNLDLMTYLLEAFGHNSLVANNGREGLEAARRESPDLIICDVQMPDVDGYEVARQLKSHPALRTIPLIAVTAYAMVGDRDKLLALGFNGYIAKPITPETFVSEIEQYLQLTQRAAPRQLATAPSNKTPPSIVVNKNITILVVDNSAINLALVRSTLEPVGYKVVEAKNVQEGLRVARETLPDLIMSDVHMPVETGYDFLKAVKGDEQLKNIPFALISSTSQHMAEKQASYYFPKIMDFIFRPIEPATLLAKIEACLKRSE